MLADELDRRATEFIKTRAVFISKLLTYSPSTCNRYAVSEIDQRTCSVLTLDPLVFRFD